MAHKTMHLTAAGVQFYRTRMMVGDPITLSGTDARRLSKIGWVEEARKARVAKVEAKPEPKAEPKVEPVVAPVVEPEPEVKVETPAKKAVRRRKPKP